MAFKKTATKPAGKSIELAMDGKQLANCKASRPWPM
jgi:hypothetical protein